MRRKGLALRDLNQLPPGFGFLLVEMGASSAEEAHAKAEALARASQSWPSPPVAHICAPDEAQAVWHVRESALGAMVFVPGEPDRWEGWVPDSEMSGGESIFRKIIEKAYDAIVLTDGMGKIIEWNPSAERLFGINKSDAIGRPLWDLQFGALPESARTPQAYEGIKTLLTRFLQTGSIPHDVSLSEVEIQRPDGSRLFIHTSAFPIRCAHGFQLCSMSHDITDRRRAVEALRETEEKFRSIIHTSQEWIWAIDTSARHTYSNPAVETILGYSPADFIGKDALEFMHVEDAQKVKEMFPVYVRQRKGWTGLVIRWRHKNGSYRYLESNAVPVLGTDGGLAGFWGADRDITESKKAEEALKKSEERLAQSAEQSRTITWEVDAGGLYTFVSPVSERVIGYKPEEIVGKSHFYDLHPETGREAFKAAAFETFCRKAPFNALENPIRTKEGGIVWVITSGIPLLNENGTLRGYRGNDTDITGRKRAEEALHDSQQMLQTVLDTIPVAVFWKDRNLRYLGGNRTWLNAVGSKSSEAVIGKSDYDLPWEKTQADSFREDDRRVMESGTAEFNIIEPYLRADGTQAWARTNKVPLRDADGNIIGILGTYEDITERKRMEEELHKAQKLESLGLLAGGIAHDFNNLMGGIFGYIDLALASSKNSAVSNYLSAAVGAIDRARNLTGQLLTFAKGGAPIREISNLSPVIRDASKLALSGSNVSCAFTVAGRFMVMQV